MLCMWDARGSNFFQNVFFFHICTVLDLCVLILNHNWSWTIILALLYVISVFFVFSNSSTIASPTLTFFLPAVRFVKVAFLISFWGWPFVCTDLWFDCQVCSWFPFLLFVAAPVLCCSVSFPSAFSLTASSFAESPTRSSHTRTHARTHGRSLVDCSDGQHRKICASYFLVVSKKP